MRPIRRPEDASTDYAEFECSLQLLKDSILWPRLSKAKEALREKESKAFTAKKSELDSNIGALSKAIPAIEKDMSGAFLQTNAASVLRQISVSADMIPLTVTCSHLSSQMAAHMPQNRERSGILQTLKDEMEADLSGKDDLKGQHESTIAK